MGAIFGFLLMGAAAALIVTFFPDAVPALRRENRAAMAFDALAALLAAAGIALALRQFQGILLDRFHAQAVLSIGSPDIIASAAPALAALANAVRGVLTDAALLGLLALLAWQLTRPWMRYAAALLALCATIPGEVRTPGEFVLHYAISLAMAAAGIAFCWFFARRNYLAYALVLWLMALRTPMMQLLGTGNSALQMQGYLLAAIMLATLVWAFAPAFLRRNHPGIPSKLWGQVRMGLAPKDSKMRLPETRTNGSCRRYQRPLRDSCLRGPGKRARRKRSVRRHPRSSPRHGTTHA